MICGDNLTARTKIPDKDKNSRYKKNFLYEDKNSLYEEKFSGKEIVMKKNYISKLAVVFLVIFSGIIASGCENTKFSERDFIRFHIRADSNSAADQQVKLKVRDEVVAYLESRSLGKDAAEVYRTLGKLKPELKRIADGVLEREGFGYRATVTLDTRYFPARSYGDFVVDSGWYDALIIELGSGKGDNWWCVVYPPLCYLEAKAEKDVRYKSKIKELLKKYF